MVFATGCEKKPALVPVQGRVTLDEQPVKDMMVNFTAIGETQGSGALGATDGDGKFTLMDVRGGEGAYAGEYKVSFYPGGTRTNAGDPADVVGAARSKDVPAIYLDGNQSPLRATVPPGGGTVDVFLTKTGKGGTTKVTPNGPAK